MYLHIFVFMKVRLWDTLNVSLSSAKKKAALDINVKYIDETLDLRVNESMPLAQSCVTKK